LIKRVKLEPESVKAEIPKEKKKTKSNEDMLSESSDKKE